MVPLHDVVGFAIASALLIMIPGPSVLFTISRAMVLGRRAALVNVVGNATGAAVQIVAVAAGLGALVAQSVAAYTVVKWVGAAYIVYLGIQAIRHRRAGEEAVEITRSVTKTSRVYREGFVVGITNPKTIVFLVAVLPQFVARELGAVPAQMLVLGAVFIAIALCFDSLWALGAGAARDWFARSPSRMQRLRAAGGTIMVGLGVSIAAGGRPD
ncbi:LysE family translocator [Mumia zhuanghuii]|uniref:LysE family translocator n=2 Tax=Mumia TaxID=1546255 RepID=A0ABW1QHQ5_9ACTN|nr:MULTISPECIES: LysE family translocator [Mumia]KAA1422626.1 LysE family translocator [Mumia zhuanghuii]